MSNNNLKNQSKFPYKSIPDLPTIRNFYQQFNNPLNNFTLRNSFLALENAKKDRENFFNNLFSTRNQMSSAISNFKEASNLRKAFQNLTDLQSRLEQLKENFYTPIIPKIELVNENFLNEPIETLNSDSIFLEENSSVKAINELIDVQKETMEIIKELVKSTNESVNISKENSSVSKEASRLQKEEIESNKITETFNKKMAYFTLWIGIATLIATVIPLITGLLK